MEANIQLTQEYLQSIFEYRIDGFLIWKVKKANRTKIGEVAGYAYISHGELRHRIIINNKRYLASRIIFLYHKGYMPKLVDHKNRVTSDNRIVNLRDATHAQNARNATSAKGSSAKYLGVSIFRPTNRWRACISINGKNRHLGLFDLEQDAALAYNKVANELYGEFANLNIVTL